jgi:hypothetical protein
MTSVTAVESRGVSGNQKISQRYLLLDLLRTGGGQIDRFFTSADLRAIRAPQRGGDPGRGCVRRLIQQRRLHGNRGGLGVGFRDTDENAPRRDLHRVGDIKPDVAINAGAGVPAGIFLLRVIDPDGKNIAGASLQGWGEIDKKAREAVGMRIELLPVEIDIGVHVDPLELDSHAFALPVCGGLQMVAIPADAGGKKAALPTHRRFRVHLALDAPVMRQCHGSPVGIGKVCGRSVLRIAQEKFPIVVDA